MSRTASHMTTATTLTFGAVSVETNTSISSRDTMSQKVQLGNCHVKSIETSGRQLLHRHMEMKKTTSMRHSELKETRLQIAKATTKKNTRDTTTDDEDVSATKERLHRVSLAVATELCALIEIVSIGTFSLQHGPDPGRIVRISVRSATHRPNYRTMKRVHFPTIYEEPDQEVLEESEETEVTEEERDGAVSLTALQETLEDAPFITTKNLEVDWENTYVTSTQDLSDPAPTETDTIPTTNGCLEMKATDPIQTTNGSDPKRDTDATRDSTTKRKASEINYTLFSPTRLWVRIPSTNATRRVHWGQQSPRCHRHRLATVVEVKENAKVTLRKQTVVLLGSQWSPLQTQH